jgi:hypothetical protein
MAQSLFIPFANSPLLTWNPSFCVVRSRPPWSQVAHKLTSPPSFPPHSNFPTPRSFPKSTMRPTKTTSRSRLHIVWNIKDHKCLYLGISETLLKFLLLSFYEDDVSIFFGSPRSRGSIYWSKNQIPALPSLEDDICSPLPRYINLLLKHRFWLYFCPYSVYFTSLTSIFLVSLGFSLFYFSHFPLFSRLLLHISPQ